jgi:hypothetical protein
LVDRMLCYNKVNSEEIEARNNDDCKIPIQYNHTFAPLRSLKFMPTEGRTVVVLLFRGLYTYDVEIKMFHSKPLERKNMMLAMERDFK